MLSVNLIIFFNIRILENVLLHTQNRTNWECWFMEELFIKIRKPRIMQHAGVNSQKDIKEIKIYKA